MILAFIQNMPGFVLLLISLFYLLLWVYCIVDITRSSFKDPNMKLIWIVILLLAHGVGPIIYLIMRGNLKK